MNKIWASEYPSVLIAAGALLMLGLLTGHWFIASLLVLCVYILWLYRRLEKHRIVT